MHLEPIFGEGRLIKNGEIFEQRVLYITDRKVSINIFSKCFNTVVKRVGEYDIVVLTLRFFNADLENLNFMWAVTFMYSVDGVLRNLSMRTPNFNNPKIAILCCDNIWSNVEKGFRMLEDADPDLIVRIGDQVYTDPIYRRVLHGGKFDVKNSLVELYIRTFSSPDNLKVWQSYANIVVPDDHDYVDNTTAKNPKSRPFITEAKEVTDAIQGNLLLESAWPETLSFGEYQVLLYGGYKATDKGLEITPSDYNAVKARLDTLSGEVPVAVISTTEYLTTKPGCLTKLIERKKDAYYSDLYRAYFDFKKENNVDLIHISGDSHMGINATVKSTNDSFRYVACSTIGNVTSFYNWFSTFGGNDGICSVEDVVTNFQRGFITLTTVNGRFIYERYALPRSLCRDICESIKYAYLVSV